MLFENKQKSHPYWAAKFRLQTIRK